VSALRTIKVTLRPPTDRTGTHRQGRADESAIGAGATEGLLRHGPHR
jgi:hypothetical protein